MPAVTEESLRSGKILIVDDEVGCLCLLENVLNRLGFNQLRTLSEPTKALEAFAEFQPDLVITDLRMPDLDGFQLVELLRGQVVQDASLPILVLTGCSNPSDKRRALAAGATDILIKPFDPSEILMRIRNLLRSRFLNLEIQEQNRCLEQKVAERTSALEQALAELKQSQRQVVQQERFRAFGEMAGGVVHDFNNALMSVIGYSDLLLQDPDSMSDVNLVSDYLRTINTAGRDASQVVSRLRDFYRPREETDVFAAVQVTKLLEEVVALTQPKWKDHALLSGRSIQLKLELEKVPAVLGNGADLREVVTNLIFNAVDAMPNGGIITLRTKPDNERILIEISDTGTGMTEEVRQRCLEPFFTTKGEEGTGLGLAMVFGIIKRHDGNLDIDSELGRGTTFRIDLPCYQHSEPVGESSCLTIDRSLRVLVVDDEPNARDVVTKYLKADGHKVTTACNGDEAMQRFLADDFDIVITDHGMPGMNGLELAETVHRVDTNKPVFLLTGFGIAATDIPTSVSRVMKKPIPPEDLRRALQQVMQAEPVTTSVA